MEENPYITDRRLDNNGDELTRLDVLSLAQHPSMRNAETAQTVLYILRNQLDQAGYESYLIILRDGLTNSFGGDEAEKNV